MEYSMVVLQPRNQEPLVGNGTGIPDVAKDPTTEGLHEAKREVLDGGERQGTAVRGGANDLDRRAMNTVWGACRSFLYLALMES